jgi:hypothetical protein
MKKSIYLLSVALLFFYFKSIFMINNGDPFDYISSEIRLINDAITFTSKIQQKNKIIVVIAYLNNYYGDTSNDFYAMATIYTDLKKQFANNKNIEFYRVHMSQGISPLTLDLTAPSMQIYYEGKKITSVHGRQNKNIRLRVIIDILRNNLKSIMNENDFILNIE